MPVDHTEKRIERAIEDDPLNRGYRNGDPEDFRASLGLAAASRKIDVCPTNGERS
jgi:hypothetical protein